MSCKISWPDRTQLLKHAQECSNSQVVRTKTKYKLKANCRLQLKFYLQTYLDYWQYEKFQESKNLDQLESLNNLSVPSTADTKLDCKIFLNDIILNKYLLLDTSSRNNLNSVNLNDGKKILLKDEDDEVDNSTEIVMETKEEEEVDTTVAEVVAEAAEATSQLVETEIATEVKQLTEEAPEETKSEVRDVEMVDDSVKLEAVSKSSPVDGNEVEVQPDEGKTEQIEPETQEAEVK